MEYFEEQDESKIVLSPNIYPKEVIDFFKDQGFEKFEEYPSGLWMKKEIESLPEPPSPENIDIFAVGNLQDPVSAKNLAEVQLDYANTDNFDLEDIIAQFEKIDKESEDILYGIAKLENCGEFVGFSRTIFIDLLRGDSIAQNIGLVVKEEHRSKGIGEALLVDSFHRAKDKGYGNMYISTHSNNPAQRLYKRVGFEIEREHPHLSYQISKGN